MVRQLSDGDDAGQSFGQSSTDKISFYGETPIVRATVTASTGTATTTKLEVAVNAIHTALVNLGLITAG